MYRRSARPRFTLLLLVLTAVTLLTLDERSSGFIGTVRDTARDAFAPVADAADSVFEPVGNVIQGIIHYGDLEDENARLRQELAERNGDKLRATDAERELKALSDLNNLDYVADIPTVAARVVSTAPNTFQLTVEINRGREDGIVVGMPVVSGAGLVGRIIDVSETRSTILMITDQTSSVGVRLVASGDVGVADGKGVHEDLEVGLIAPATKVATGEVVVTSGLQQSAFPPGIPVGRVSNARTEPGGLEQKVSITPVTDLRRLTFVKVLQWSSGR